MPKLVLRDIGRKTMAKNGKSNKPQPNGSKQPTVAAEQSALKPAQQTGTLPKTNTGDRIRLIAILLGAGVLVLLAVILLALILTGGNTTGEDTGENSETSAAAESTEDGSSETDSTDSSDGADGDTTTETATSADTTTESSQSADDTDGEDAADEDASDESPNTDDSSNSLPDSYTQVAGTGDSVSWMARRAMYSYLADRGLSLSTAQRLFMEVTLTNASNPVYVQPGESRVFAASLLDSVYQQAVGLTQAQLNAWQAEATSVGYI